MRNATTPRAASLRQGGEQDDDHPSAGRACGMAERAGAPVNVQRPGRKTEVLSGDPGHNSEGLVALEQVCVAHRPAALVQHLAHGG